LDPQRGGLRDDLYGWFGVAWEAVCGYVLPDRLEHPFKK
jgi:hypothetical protein